MCSPILVSGSDLLKHRATHNLDACSVIQLFSVIQSNSQTRYVFSQFHQWFWSARRLESDSLAVWSAILVSGSDLLKNWRATHSLDQPFSSVLLTWSKQRITYSLDAHQCSTLLVVLICSKREEQLTSWTHSNQRLRSGQKLEGTHNLDICSTSLISGSDLIKDWRETHNLDSCSATFVSSNIEE